MDHQLFAGYERGSGAAGAGHCRSPPHGRSTYSPGDSGWGKYARLREKPQSSGNDRAGGLSGNAASGKSKTSAQCFSSGGARRKWDFAMVALAMSGPHTQMLSWSLPLAIISALVAVTALVYLRGWLWLRNAFPNLIPGWLVAGVMVGLVFV